MKAELALTMKQKKKRLRGGSKKVNYYTSKSF